MALPGLECYLDGSETEQATSEPAANDQGRTSPTQACELANTGSKACSPPPGLPEPAKCCPICESQLWHCSCTLSPPSPSCPAGLDDIKPLQEAVALPCAHSFCSACLEKWTWWTGHRFCPMCKVSTLRATAQQAWLWSCAHGACLQGHLTRYAYLRDDMQPMLCNLPALPPPHPLGLRQDSFVEPGTDGLAAEPRVDLSTWVFSPEQHMELQAWRVRKAAYDLNVAQFVASRHAPHLLEASSCCKAVPDEERERERESCHALWCSTPASLSASRLSHTSPADVLRMQDPSKRATEAYQAHQKRRTPEDPAQVLLATRVEQPRQVPAQRPQQPLQQQQQQQRPDRKRRQPDTEAQPARPAKRHNAQQQQA